MLAQHATANTSPLQQTITTQEEQLTDALPNSLTVARQCLNSLMEAGRNMVT